MAEWDRTAWIAFRLSWSPVKYKDCHPILKGIGGVAIEFEEMYELVCAQDKKQEKPKREVLTEDEIEARHRAWLKRGGAIERDE